jgi:hypothetical protein
MRLLTGSILIEPYQRYLKLTSRKSLQFHALGVNKSATHGNEPCKNHNETKKDKK